MSFGTSLVDLPKHQLKDKTKLLVMKMTMMMMMTTTIMMMMMMMTTMVTMMMMMTTTTMVTMMNDNNHDDYDVHDSLQVFSSIQQPPCPREISDQ